MQLTLGDLVLIEIALANFLKGMDLSMQAGQQLAGVIGKIEYQIGAIQEQQAKGTPPAIAAPTSGPSAGAPGQN